MIKNQNYNSVKEQRFFKEESVYVDLKVRLRNTFKKQPEFCFNELNRLENMALAKPAKIAKPKTNKYRNL
jgi:hypothetical protein